jgi:hypothetical protein
VIISNSSRGTVIGETIEVAQTASQKVKGLLGRECLEDGQGLLFKGAGSLHTLFMRFPIDVIYADKKGKVVKIAPAPLRCHYALELPVGAIAASRTEVGDHLSFEEEPEELDVAG